MKLSSHKIERERRLELSMTSMIDVVFLLLIFFMTTAAFVRTERNLDSAIKVDRESSQQEQSDFEPAIVEVVQSDRGFVYQVGSRTIQTQRELVNVLRQFENKADGAFVRVVDAAPFRMAAAAVQACKTARFPVVSYMPID